MTTETPCNFIKNLEGLLEIIDNIFMNVKSKPHQDILESIKKSALDMIQKENKSGEIDDVKNSTSP